MTWLNREGWKSAWPAGPQCTSVACIETGYISNILGLLFEKFRSMREKGVSQKKREGRIYDVEKVVSNRIKAAAMGPWVPQKRQRKIIHVNFVNLAILRKKKILLMNHFISHKIPIKRFKFRSIFLSSAGKCRLISYNFQAASKNERKIWMICKCAKRILKWANLRREWNVGSGEISIDYFSCSM